MKTKEIRDLIDFISQTGLNEVNIETEELKLSIKRNPDITTTGPVSHSVATTPVMSSAPQVTVDSGDSGGEEKAAAANSKYIEIKSPMIGTFYRSSNPESEPFVSVGDNVEKGQTVCIIEAMKLFNEIEADISGTVVKVLVDDSSPVEYDQPLYLIDPS